MSFRAILSVGLLLIGATAPAMAQAPSPLDLVQGIRESGMPDLALEYLKDIEGKLSPADKLVLPLERAKCLLDAAEEESDEGTRTSMVNEAKQAFSNFLATNANHPRVSEAALAVARLTSIEAKAQLNRARRMDIPPKDEEGHDAAIAKQQEEAGKARPLFNRASTEFAKAAQQMKAKLEDKSLDIATRQKLTREAFDADLSAAINQYYLAETFIVTGAKGTIERDKFLEEARERFAKFADGPTNSRTVWIGRAWMAEVLGDQGKNNQMNEEFAKILAFPRLEAEEGKRLVRFFQIRRAYIDALGEGTISSLNKVEGTLRSWLSRHGKLRKPTQESLAAQYYLAYSLQRQGAISIGNAKPDPITKAINLSTTVRRQFEEAERLYRTLSQGDHDYTSRSAQNRMYVVRRLIGEADKPASDYATFETAQMAALIQMAKLNDAERDKRAAAETNIEEEPFWAGLFAQGNGLRATKEVEDRKFRVVALLERARELAKPQDTPADVVDNLLRLVYFYQLSDQPYQAAVLGEHIARTMRTTGGKGATAGLMALNGYTQASSRIKTVVNDATMADAVAASAAAARKADRVRAIDIAKYVDEKFPNDTATDSARHRLAMLYNEDGKSDDAFQTVVKIRPGYSGIYNARQLEGYLASVIVNAKDGFAPERKVAVFRQAIGDLLRVAKPAPNSAEDDVRGYVGCRIRLAYLFLVQNRVDPETEKTAPGYTRALAVGDEVIAAMPTFDALKDEDKMGPNPDRLELAFQGYDVRTRALYLQAKTLVDTGDLEAAGKVVDEAAAGLTKGAFFDDRMKKWSGGQGDEGDDEPTAAKKSKAAGLASAIDKTRRDIVMVGFKLRCVQGDPAGAGKMLDLLKAAGGGVEANQSSLELMARELAAQIPPLRAQGKAKEAADLGAGLVLLLNEFATLKDPTSSTTLFLGQTFHTVGEHDKAVVEFRKVKSPSQPDWATRKLQDFPQEIRSQLDTEIREYRFAQLYLGKALREGGKLAEAESHMLAIMGTPEKKGWGYNSLDVRKEIATLYEAKGASLAEPKAANQEYGKALKEWSTLYSLTQRAAGELKPESPIEDVRRVKSNFFDSFFEVQRVIVTANSQLQKGSPKLAGTFDNVARQFMSLENIHKLDEMQKQGNGIITAEVWTRYCDLLDKYPELKNAYKIAGGKFFLERPKTE